MKKILICEDDINIVSLLKTELAYAGYDTTAAYDGKEAIKLFSDNSYDLVILDLILPHKNGLEVLQEIRRNSDIPVIVLTARKDIFDKVLFLKSGADDYVTKPFDMPELLARVERKMMREWG